MDDQPKTSSQCGITACGYFVLDRVRQIDAWPQEEGLAEILGESVHNGGGTNFDAKIRRNSTDLDDLFIAHIAGMDTFARALIAADRILAQSPYKQWRTERYASFDGGKGADFVNGKLSLEELASIGAEGGEPKQISGKQELYETLINQYL